MNIGRLVGGLLCLGASVLLAVLSAVLPEGKVVFMVNGANMPIVPIAGLLMLGVLLLASSVRRRLA